MRRQSWVRACIVAVLAGVLACQSSAGAQEPPPLDIPISALTSGLGPQHTDQVRKRLEYWRDLLVAADRWQTVGDARSGILGDYRRYESREYQYQYAFARLAGEALLPLLRDALRADDKLLALKQVNTAQVLSEMSQVTILPALEEMVAHDNQAVRFLGWEGYRKARIAILSQTRNEVRRFLDTLRAAAGNEDSPPVLAGIFQVCAVSSFGAATIPEATIRESQTRAFETLHANWRRWCRRLLAGDVEMIRAMPKAIAAVQVLAGGADDEAARTRALQMVVDVMRAVSLAYDDAGAEGPVADEGVALLLACERALNAEDGALYAITTKRGSHVASALAERDIAIRRTRVPLAVLRWVEELGGFGVVRSDFDQAEPAPPAQPSPAGAEAQ